MLMAHEAGRDHPRVCGEKTSVYDALTWLLGSPPRVRGKVPTMSILNPFLRITPACAGKSTMLEIGDRPFYDHPRVCGEKHLTN